MKYFRLSSDFLFWINDLIYYGFLMGGLVRGGGYDFYVIFFFLEFYFLIIIYK